MAGKLSLLFLVIISTILTASAEKVENSCCGKMEEIINQIAKECSEEDEEDEECFHKKLNCYDEHGNEDLKKINVFIDKLECSEEEKVPLRNNARKCLNDDSVKCNNEFLEICPNFCKFYNEDGIYDACNETE